MNNQKIKFKKWLEFREMCGTGAIYDPKAKGEFNWWGAPGSAGKTVKEKPIKKKNKK